MKPTEPPKCPSNDEMPWRYARNRELAPANRYPIPDWDSLKRRDERD